MNNKTLLLPAFVLVALVQLYIPAKMIWDREDVLDTGTTYKFKTAPIDPNDPFRGKYITLGFEETTVEVPNEQQWKVGESIYASLITDNNGFAKIKSVSKTMPTDNQDFIKAKVSLVTGNGSNKLTLEFPFDRYYMDESKAYDAELTYIHSQLDPSKTTYALVGVKNGVAVIKDVMIDETSIRELVKSTQKKK